MNKFTALAAMIDQITKQLRFLGGEADGFAVPAYLPFGKIDRHASKLESNDRR